MRQKREEREIGTHCSFGYLFAKDFDDSNSHIMDLEDLMKIIIKLNNSKTYSIISHNCKHVSEILYDWTVNKGIKPFQI